MKIFFAKHPTEAHIVSELLKAEGIDSEVRGEGLFGLKGELPFTQDSDPCVWLFDSAKYTQAKQIINEYQQQNHHQEADWKCENCGESNEGQFGACWQCGALFSI